VLRERVFFLGGAVVIVLGGLLGFGLWYSGAGLDYWSAWFSAGIAVGLGAFFLYVGRQAQAFRRAWLRAHEEGRPPPPGGPPG
jgi:hypothetical protein